MKRKRNKIIGIVLSLLFLVLVFWRIDFNEFAAALSTANYWYVAPAAVCTLLGYIIRTTRWSVLLNPAKRIPLVSLFPILMIGFAANNVLPARIGEFVRAYTLGSRQNVSKSLGLATIFLERLFDGVTLILLVVVALPFLPLLLEDVVWNHISIIIYVAAAVFGVASVCVVGLLVQRELALRLLSIMLKPLPARISARVANIVDLFIVGLEVLRGRWAVLVTFGLSVVVWSMEALSYWLILQGFDTGLDGQNLAFAALFLLVIVNLGTMVPSAPGYFGAFELGGALALSAFGVNRELAVSVALVSHAMQYILVTGIGFVCMWVANLSFRQIVEEEST